MNRILRFQLSPNPGDLAVFDTTTGSSSGRTRARHAGLIMAMLVSFVCAFQSNVSGQAISAYSFSASSGTYTAVTGTTISTTTWDDQSTTAVLPIGFTFTYGGTAFTNFGVNNNGFIQLGSNPVSSYTPISSLTTGNIIAPFARDLQGQAGSSIQYTTSGSAPNRVLVVQWTNYRRYGGTGQSYNFQIKLYEGTNSVQFVYGTFTPNTTSAFLAGQVGMRDAGSFANRTTTTNWAATTAGPLATSTCVATNTVKPALGQTFTWTPPAACSGTPNAGSISGITSTCSGASFTLSSSGLSAGAGITFQWQFSDDSGTSWNNVTTGGTGSTLTTSTTVSRQYRLRTDCSNSSLSNFSNVHSISLLTGVCACGAYPANFASSNADEEISNVTVGTMNNSSTCATLAPGPGSILNRYSNYCTSLSGPTAEQGSTVSFSLTQTSCGGVYGNGFQMYIDWNQDGDFADAGEQVYNQPVAATGNHTKTGTFVVPVAASLGTTRMRVVVVETGFPTTTNYASAAYSWGETEDYCFTVTAPPPCTGTPSAGVVSGPASSCASVNITLTASDLTAGLTLTYQWQSSTDDGITWNNIAGQTSPTLVTQINATRQFRVQSTCGNSGEVNISNVHTVNLLSGACVCATYPVVAASVGGDEDLSNVTVGTMNNSSNCATTAPGAGSINQRYSNYTSSVSGPTAAAGSSVSFSLTQTTCGGNYNHGFQIYVDWNQNGSFADAGEQMYSSPAGSGSVATSTATGSFTVPLTALGGSTRMRVIVVETGFPTTVNYATTTYSYGETEDYCFTVIPLPATPAAPVADGGSNCLVGSVLTAGTPPAGITFYWQTAADGTDQSNSTASYTVYSNGTYYLRAYDAANALWSANSASLVVSSFVPETAPTAIIAAANPACVNTDLTMDPAPSGVAYYWQGTNATGTSTANEATAAYNVTANGTYVVRTYNATTGCWSDPTTLAVAVYVFPSATVAYLSPYNCASANGSIVFSPTGAGTVFNSDFSTSTLPAGTTSAGNDFNASDNGRMRLTSNGTSKTGGVLIPNTTGLASNDLAIDFDLITVSSGGEAADGVSYSYGSDVVALPSGTPTNPESGSGTGLKLSFDAYTNGLNAAGVYLMYNSNVANPTPTSTGVLGYVNNTAWRASGAAGSTNTTHVTIKINASSQVSVWLNGVEVVNNVALPAGYAAANKVAWKHAFAARTGGLAQGHYIDNLNIRYNLYEFSIDGGATWTANSPVTAAPGSYNSQIRYAGLNCQTGLGDGTINALVPPTTPVIAGPTAVCSGSTFTLNASYTYAGSSSDVALQWYRVAPAASTCNYTFNLGDSFGDGWNGGTMQVMNGTTVVQTLGASITGSSSTVSVPVNAGTSYSLVWNAGGFFPEEIGIDVLNAAGSNIYNLPFNSDLLVGTTLTTFTAACPSGNIAIVGATTTALTTSQTAATDYYLQYTYCGGAPMTTANYNVAMDVPTNCYCTPNYTFGKTDGDLISNIVIAGTTLSNNSGTAPTNPAYTFFQGQPNYTADLNAASQYQVTVTIGSFVNQGIAAWIDYNDDGLFSTTEKLGNTGPNINTAFGSATFPINISCNPPVGPHRMRVRGVYATSGSTIDPCLTYNWGEAEDYIINILPAITFTPTFTATPAATVCTQEPLTYTTQSGQGTYTWTIPGVAGTDYVVISGATGTSNTTVLRWVTGGSKTVTVDYLNPSGCTSTGAASFTNTVNVAPNVTITSTASSFCGVAGTSVLTATNDLSIDPSNFTWTTNSFATGTLSSTSGSVVTASIPTVTEVTNFGYTAAITDLATSCVGSSEITVLNFTFPAFQATINDSATPTDVCANSTINLAAGVSAGAFSVTTTPYAWETAPAIGVTNLVTAGVATVAENAGSNIPGDDSGWDNQPIGFDFNFFGTNYTNFNVSSNGFLQFSSPQTLGSLYDYSFPNALPTTLEPTNAIFVCAGDWAFGGQAAANLRYWLTGSTPTQKLVVEYSIPGFGGNGLVQAQAHIFESTGIVEIHVQTASSTAPKTVGVQNALGTIGSTAPSFNASTATNWSNQAWRFNPPVNYTYSWSVDNGGTVAGATSELTTSVPPVGTTNYTVTITNPLSACTQQDVVTINVPADPTPSFTSVIPATLCGSTPVTYTTQPGMDNYNWMITDGSNNPLTFGTDYTVVGNTTTSNTADVTWLTDGVRKVSVNYVTPLGCAVATGASATLTFSPTTVLGTLTSSAASVCINTSADLNLAGSTGVIQWQSSSDNVTFADVTGANSATYNTGDLTSTTYYQAVVTSGVCGSLTSSPVTVLVDPATVPGILSSDVTIGCAGITSGTITLAGYTGSILDWEFAGYSASLADWLAYTAVTNTTNTQSFADLTQTTRYRARVKSGICNEVYTDPIVISVTPYPVAQLTESSTVCNSTNAIFPIQVSNSDGYSGTFTVVMSDGSTVTGTSAILDITTSTMGTPISLVSITADQPGCTTTTGFLGSDQITLNTYYQDTDNDGYGVSTSTSVCPAPATGYAALDGDCAPTNAGIYPNAPETCNDGIDQNCDGADEACAGDSYTGPVVVGNIGQFGYGVQTNLTANLVTATNSVESPGIGNDLWFSFVAQGNAVRIALTGSSSVADDNDLGLYSYSAAGGSQLVPLTTENAVTPATAASFSPVPDGGSEIMYYDQLVPQQTYLICVRNVPGSVPGICNLSVGYLRGSQADIGPFTGGTGVYNNTCANFKAAFRSQAAGYTVKRWEDQAAADAAVAPSTFGVGIPSWSYAIPPQTNGSANTICQLGKVLPANLSGFALTYYVTVDVTYNLKDAAGNNNLVTAYGDVASPVGLNTEFPLFVRLTDLCNIGAKRTTAFIATNRSVCGTARYDWKFKQAFPTPGLPSYIAGGAGATRLVGLSTVPSIANGQRYDVWIRAAHLDGNSYTTGTAVGNPLQVNTWFPTTGGCTTPTSSLCAGNASCVKLIGNAGMTLENNADVTTASFENEVTAMIFPNPNNGQIVNLYVAGMEGDLKVRVLDATGRVVYNNRYVVEGSINTNIDFGQVLAGGVYMVELVQNGDLQTMRMVVNR